MIEGNYKLKNRLKAGLLDLPIGGLMMNIAFQNDDMIYVVPAVILSSLFLAKVGDVFSGEFCYLHSKALKYLSSGQIDINKERGVHFTKNLENKI